MQQIPQIVWAGFDDLIPVVIIITVMIARIMKAAKEGKPVMSPPAAAPSQRPTGPSQRPAGPAPVATDPAKELREFLESISGVSIPEPVPAAPPPTVPHQRLAPPPAPPRATRFEKRIKHHTRPKNAAPVAATPQPTAPPPPRKRYWQQEPPKPRPIVVEACELSPYRQALDEHLNDRESLRGAILLREVLGPPVGLRH